MALIERIHKIEKCVAKNTKASLMRPLVVYGNGGYFDTLTGTFVQPAQRGGSIIGCNTIFERDEMKQCTHCKKPISKLEGEGVMCECGELFVLCSVCIKELHGANCPKCKEFVIVFDEPSYW